MWFPFRFAKTTAITLYQPAQLINYFYYVPSITYDVEGEKKQNKKTTKKKRILKRDDLAAGIFRVSA